MSSTGGAATRPGDVIEVVGESVVLAATILTASEMHESSGGITWAPSAM